MEAVTSLWIIGALCVVAAIFGKQVKIAGNELPGLASTRLRVLLFLVGAGIVGLGFLAMPGGATAGGQQASGGGSSGGGSGQQGQAAPPVRSQNGVYLQQKSLKLDSDGVDLDFNPPRPVSTHNLAAGGDALSAGDGVAIAEWTTDHTPNENECASWLASHAGSRVDLVVVGTVVCVRTAESRIGYLTITKADDSVEADVTVWSK